MILVIREPATAEQLSQMAELYYGLAIKLAVDVRQEILAGGGRLHYDCEQVLLKDGSYQQDVWGADWYPETQEVGFESIVNIRPSQQNRGMKIRDPILRANIETIVRRLLEVS